MSGSTYQFTTNGGQAPSIAAWLVGVAPSVIQGWLADAQAAYQELATGAKARVVTYGLGDGQRSVTYSQATLAGLQAHMQQLQAALGQPNMRRRAIGVRY